MIIEALTPFTVKTKTLGHVSLEVGDRLEWPDQAVLMLLEKYPEKVRAIEVVYGPFHIGQIVDYRIPTTIKSLIDYAWAWHTGTIADIDFHNERLMIIPQDEDQPWRIIAWCYACPRGDADEQ